MRPGLSCTGGTRAVCHRGRRPSSNTNFSTLSKTPTLAPEVFYGTGVCKSAARSFAAMIATTLTIVVPRPIPPNRDPRTFRSTPVRAPTARRPTLIDLLNDTSWTTLRLQEASDFGIGARNFTHGMEPITIRFPQAKYALRQHAGSPTNLKDCIDWRLTRQHWRMPEALRSQRGAELRVPGRATRTRLVPRPIPVTGRVVSDVLQALASLVMVSSRLVPAQPAWLPAWPEGIPAPDDPIPSGPEPPWAADEILPAKNALVHLPSLMAEHPHSIPPSPRFFNAYALEYDFDPAAPQPREWLGFLEQVWGADEESIAALQEWFGYLLTPDTRQQKILMMVGPKRSGRGTIARVLKALAGSNSVVNPTLSTLARPFGLSSFIGKPIAVFPDARLSSRPDNAAIVECLLSISGEDDQTIDRKHMPAWTGKLTTRFVLISNELPRLRDVSGALAGRLIILRFTRSFYGHEDMALFDRLRPELPGILRWAIAGWERLNRRGKFLQPRSAGELVATMDELASPIASFLRDRCVIEDDATCPVPTLYEAWRSWCQERGREAVGDEHSFGRDLHAVIPGLATTRPRTPLGRLRHYQGIRLAHAARPRARGGAKLYSLQVLEFAILATFSLTGPASISASNRFDPCAKRAPMRVLTYA